MSDNAESKAVNKPGVQSPDIDLVNAADWPKRDFPLDDGRRENSVRVVIRQSVLNDIHRHGQSTTDVEICGVLVGAGYRDERGPFVYVEANIRGRHSDSKTAQVTFTGETWNHIHNELDREYPELQILGWYHTHPGFGIFLSGMDLFIHENYFSGEHQLAFVYDPIGGDEGLFVWRNGKAVRDGFLVERDAEENPPPVSSAPPSEPMTAGAAPPESAAAHSADSDLDLRVARLEQRQSLATLGIFAAILLAIAVPLAIWLLWIEPRLPAKNLPGPTDGSYAPPPSALEPETKPPRKLEKETESKPSENAGNTPDDGKSSDGETPRETIPKEDGAKQPVPQDETTSDGANERG